MSRARLISALFVASLVTLNGAAPRVGAVSVPVISSQVTISTGSTGSSTLSLEGVSCATAGNCTAVGSLTNASNGSVAPVAVNESDGKWGDPIAISLPGAAVESGSLNGLLAVQCFSAGSCIAVGRFADSALGTTTAMATAEVDGVWQMAVPITQPTNGNADVSSWLTGLSCQSFDSCTAVGTYFDTSNDPEPMAVTESGGTWQSATEIQIASPYQPIQGSWHVSCAAQTTCVATGSVGASSGDVAAAASEADGGWGEASAVSSTPGAEINAISCSQSACVAVGDEGATGATTPVTFNELNGTWNEKAVSTAPVGGGAATLAAISCVSAGNCAAAGDVTTGTGAFALAEEDGAWTNAINVPVKSARALSYVGVTGISCTSLLSCVAVGYVGTDVNQLQGVAWTSSRAPRHTIECRRGSHVRKVTAVDPRCPSGYRKS